jgi:hypothetical protein
MAMFFKKPDHPLHIKFHKVFPEEVAKAQAEGKPEP